MIKVKRVIYGPIPFTPIETNLYHSKRPPFEYDDITSLSGTIIAASRGVYKSIDSAVENDNAKRVDAADEYSVLSLVLMGRADTGIVSQASLPLFIEQHHLKGKLHIST